MYSLTLTREDRKAIDWIGDRYAHGSDLKRLLWNNDDVDTDSDAEELGDDCVGRGL